MSVCPSVTLVACAQIRRDINVWSLLYDSTNLSWRRLTLSSINFSLKWPTPWFLPRIGQKREFRQNGWEDGDETWQAGCRRPLSDCVSLRSHCPTTQPHFPYNHVPWDIPPFAGLFVDFCHSTNHLSRTFWVINIRLKYFPNSDRRFIFSQNKFLH